MKWELIEYSGNYILQDCKTAIAHLAWMRESRWALTIFPWKDVFILEAVTPNLAISQAGGIIRTWYNKKRMEVPDV